MPSAQNPLQLHTYTYRYMNVTTIAVVLRYHIASVCLCYSLLLGVWIAAAGYDLPARDGRLHGVSHAMYNVAAQL